MLNNTEKRPALKVLLLAKYGDPEASRFTLPRVSQELVAGMVGTPVAAAFPASPQFALQVARWHPWAAPHHPIRIEPNWPIVAADAIEDLLR